MGLENFILTCEKDNESLRKDINYYKNYNKRLKKENKELKKQLEVGKEQYNDLVEEKEELQEQLSNSYQIKTQQKEFIEYLESEIKRLEENNIYEPLQRTALVTFQHVLSKYKEIIGDKNEIQDE